MRESFHLVEGKYSHNRAKIDGGDKMIGRSIERCIDRADESSSEYVQLETMWESWIRDGEMRREERRE